MRHAKEQEVSLSFPSKDWKWLCARAAELAIDPTSYLRMLVRQASQRPAEPIPSAPAYYPAPQQRKANPAPPLPVGLPLFEEILDETVEAMDNHPQVMSFDPDPNAPETVVPLRRASAAYEQTRL